MDPLPLALHSPSPSYAIRPVQWSDVELLRHCCWPDRSPGQVQRLVSRALRLAEHRHGCGMVVEQDGVIAYGQLTQWPRAAEISDLIVCESWRSQGVGTALIQTLVSLARTMEIARVEIGVALDNTRALALYRRLGFRDKRTVHLDFNGVRTPVLYLDLSLTPTGDG